MPVPRDIGPPLPLPPSRRASLDPRTLPPSSTASGSSRRSLLFEFATLLGSGRRRNKPDITAPEFFSAYAGPSPLSPLTMQHERPSRPPKQHNKLYTFLTRSRSRSRSKPEPPQQQPQGTKPASRIQSRPLSAATSSTVTPKRPQRSPPTADVPPRPSTSGGGARQKLHDLFGIALARKPTSRSRSRPATPVYALEAPPLPATDDRSSYAPAPVLRVTNPTTDSTGSTAPSTNIFSASPSPGPPVLPPIPPVVSRVSSLHRRSAKDPDQPPPPKIIHTPPTPLRSGPSSGTVSASTSASSSRVPASTSTSASSVPSRPGHVPKGSLDSNYRYRAAALHMRSVAEEATTPLPPASDTGHHGLPMGKVREPLPRPLLTKMSSSARATKHGSFDFERPGWSAGPVAMQRSGSGGTSASSRRSGVGMDAVTRERERESVYGPGMAGVGTLQREVSMKRAQEREDLLHGQKDRSRKPDKREKSNERTRGSTSQRTTPDTVHASTSSASGTPNTNGKSSSMGRAAGRRTVPLLPKRLVGIAQLGPFSFEPAVALPSPTRSTGSASTGTAHELTVSTARTERERTRLRDEKARNGGPGKRRSGDRAPVPVPAVPPAYTYAYHSDDGSAPESPGPVPVQMPLTLSAVLEGAPAVEQTKLGPPGSLGRTPSGAVRPPRPAPGHRSGTKGRSLDLGLGLSWAATKVREEALLPKSAFFTRTPSLGSNRDRAAPSTGRTRHGSGGTAEGTGAIERTASGASSRSGLGRNGGGTQTERDVERARLGREVAEVFRAALDGDRYKLFKTYVHQFDAHEIPFDGPLGIVARVEDLIVSSPKRMSDAAQKSLMDKFVRIILQVA